MIEVETYLYTDIERAKLFEWQVRLFAAHPGKKCLRVDTWELQNHPSPGGPFTLYACTIVLAEIDQGVGEMRRGALRP